MIIMTQTSFHPARGVIGAPSPLFLLRIFKKGILGSVPSISSDVLDF